MRIGVDACCWANGRGYGRFTRELLAALVPCAPDDEFVFFADTTAARAIASSLQASNVRVVEVRQSAPPTEAAAADGSRSPADMLRFSRAVWRERLHGFFSPSVYTYFPLPPGLAPVIAVHDAIAERFPGLTHPSSRARLFWRGKVAFALWQARFVLTVSEYAARDLMRTMRLHRDVIRVTGEAPSPTFRPSDSTAEIAATAKRYELRPGDRWFTYVGGFNPHKNVPVLIEAHARLAAGLGERAPHLLLVGTTTEDVFHGNLGEIRAAITRAGTDQLVHWTGFVPDEQLRHLHSGAIALVLPSECEGFGLPAVEAAACGAPVIATTESPLPEILAGGGMFVPPGAVDLLFDALDHLAANDDVRTALGARARDRAAELSWTRSARVVLDTLYEAAA